MRTRAEHTVYNDGHTITLLQGHERGDLSWPLLGRRTARSAVSALGELSRDLMRPLEFGVTRHVVKEIEGFVGLDRSLPSPWNWYLRTPDTPSFASPGYIDPVMVEAEAIDEAGMFSVAARALDEPCAVPAGHWVDWDEMYAYDTMARVVQAPSMAGHLTVDDDDNRNLGVRIPVVRAGDGTVWVHRGGVVTWPPLTVRVTNHVPIAHPDSADFDTVIEIQIDVHWSLWWAEGTPGRILLEDALERLQAQGWTLVLHGRLWR